MAVTKVGAIVVETDDAIIAIKVVGKIMREGPTDEVGVRGVVVIEGKTYRWSTLQQYEYHDGFVRKPKREWR